MNSEPVSRAQQEHNYERIIRDVTNDTSLEHNTVELWSDQGDPDWDLRGENWGYTKMVGLES